MRVENKLLSSFAIFEHIYDIKRYELDYSKTEPYYINKSFGISLTEEKIYQVFRSLFKNSFLIRKIIDQGKRNNIIINEKRVREFIRFAYSLRNKVGHHNFTNHSLGVRDYFNTAVIFERLFWIWFTI